MHILLPLQMITRRNELFSNHRCRPWVTMLVPPLTQLPLFVGSSMFISRLSQPPTVFDSESFLTLTSLAHADATVTLPIALGIITLANVESSRWFISEAAKEREELEQKRVSEKRAQGHVVLEPRKIVQSGLRILSVGRILIGAVVPGVRSFFWGGATVVRLCRLLTFCRCFSRVFYFTGSRPRLSASYRLGCSTIGNDKGLIGGNSIFHKRLPHRLKVCANLPQRQRPC